MAYKDKEKERAKNAEYHRRWYITSGKRQLELTKVSAAKNRRRNYAYVSELKSRGVCTDCGGSFHPAAMDYDHVWGKKVASVAVLCKEAAAIARIADEIRKCELVCSNCHRVRTYNRKQERLDKEAAEKLLKVKGESSDS